MTLEPPQILRIKRKRNQDPLQALILEDIHSAKRSKPSTPLQSTSPSPISTPRPVDQDTPAQLHNVYFTLARTDDSINESTAIDSILLDNDSSVSSRKRKFVIPNQHKDEPVPEELNDMVNSFLNNDNTGNDETTVTRKKRSRMNSIRPPEQPDEFVYDVYFISPTPLTSQNHPQSQIGYIRFFNDDNDLYQSDEEDLPKSQVVSDNEDSNAEDFYQNDYPSDEDAGSNSDLASYHSQHQNDDITNLMNDLAIKEDDLDELQQFEFGEYEDQYQDVDFLQDDVYYDGNDGGSFKRNKFFESDEHDELAIHRDRIFGKLEKMLQDEI